MSMAPNLASVLLCSRCESGHRPRGEQECPRKASGGGRGKVLVGKGAEVRRAAAANRSGQFRAAGNDGDGAGRIKERPNDKGGGLVLEACFGFLVSPRHRGRDLHALLLKGPPSFGVPRCSIVWIHHSKRSRARQTRQRERARHILRINERNRRDAPVASTMKTGARHTRATCFLFVHNTALLGF